MGNFKLVPLAIGLALASAHSVHAELAAVEAGLQYPNLSGADGQRFSQKLGFSVAAHLGQLSMAPQTSVFLAGQYQPFGVAGSADTRMQSFTGLAGIRTWGSGALFGIRPFVSLGLGMSFAWLTVPDSPTNFQHAGGYFVAQPALGFDVPITSGITACLQMPVTVMVSRPALVFWSEALSVRISL